MAKGKAKGGGSSSLVAHHFLPTLTKPASGRVSDPNINPDYLATLVFVGSNYKVYMPPKKDIYQRYLRKFTKGGKLLEAELGLA